MAKTPSRSAVQLLFLLSSALPCRASFDAPLMSPRSAAMGGAALSSAGEGDLFLNPAGLAAAREPEAAFGYESLFAGLAGAAAMGRGFASVAVPLRSVTLGAGVGGFTAEGLLQERTAELAAAARLPGGVRAGLAVKQLYHSYEGQASDDPVFAGGNSKAAFALDAGFSAPLGETPWRLGLIARNLNEPDVGLDSEDRVSRELEAGLAFELPAAGLSASADLLFLHRADASSALPCFGLEKALSGDIIKFRIGVTPASLTGGFGIRLGRISFDYALTFQRELMQDNLGSHSAGMRFRF